jgi:hypothetical protein
MVPFACQHVHELPVETPFVNCGILPWPWLVRRGQGTAEPLRALARARFSTAC